MSQYGGTEGWSDPHDQGYMQPAKTSGLAITSLVCSLIIFCPYIAQLLGLIFGLIAIISISGSGGRRKGMSLAVIGMFLSVVATVAWIWLTVAIFIPAAQSSYKATLIPSSFISNVETGAFVEARALMSQGAIARADDEAFAAFQAQLTSRYGTMTNWTPPQGFQDMQSSMNGTLSITGWITFDGAASPMEVSAYMVSEPVPGQLVPGYFLDRFTILDDANGNLVFPPGPETEAPVGETGEGGDEGGGG